ncbi:fungal-specific transcription factor domain-containing protein [Aspergillus crustosus]
MSSQTGRQRVAVACTPCRARKARCNGQLPTCARCLENGTQCRYDHQLDRRKPPSKKYVEALLSRIGILERELYQLKSPKTTTDIIDTPQPGNLPASQAVDSAHTQSPETSGLIDDLTQLYGHLDIAEDGHLRYFGAPSYFNLLRQSPYHARNPESSGNSSASSNEYHEISSGLSAGVQTELLDHFWTWQNPWQYLVHKRMFCEALEAGTYSTYCTPLLLQCILALAARYSDSIEVRDSPDQPETAGNALAEQAKAILHFEMESPTLSTVVSLAILALREMSINKESLGWIYVGMAVRIAYNLGLNHDCTEWVRQGKITEDEAEIRKITWWGCFLLDKLFVLALGRPGMIAQRDITVLKPSLLPDVEYVPWANDGAGMRIVVPVSRAVSNMNHTCEIFQMSSYTLEEIYAPNSHLALAEKEAMATRCYVQVSRFYNELPSFLKLPASPKTALPAHVYSLHLQYYVIVILLHRPFLRGTDASSIERYNHICSHAAQQVTAIMKIYRSHYTLRRIPISTIHVVATSAIIHLLAATSPSPKTARPAAKLLKYNIMCLTEMAQSWSWSLRAVRSLQILAEDWFPGLGRAERGERRNAGSRVGGYFKAGFGGEIETETEGAQVLDWLMDLESTGPGEVGGMDFDQHLWSVGFAGSA